MRKNVVLAFLTLLALLMTASVWAQQANLEINTPAIAAIQSSMQARHGVLAPHYASGAVGLTRDGLVAIDRKSVV